MDKFLLLVQKKLPGGSTVPDLILLLSSPTSIVILNIRCLWCAKDEIKMQRSGSE
jgi:hypothetical protein